MGTLSAPPPQPQQQPQLPQPSAAGSVAGSDTFPPQQMPLTANELPPPVQRCDHFRPPREEVTASSSQLVDQARAFGLGLLVALVAMALATGNGPCCPARPAAAPAPE